MNKNVAKIAEKEWPDFTMTAGPCGLSHQVLQAMSQPMVYHYDPTFLKIFRETSQKLKKILLTENDVLIMQGDAVLALEAAAYSCIRPGDKCLNIVSGYYGKGYEGYIKVNGGEVIEVAVPYDESVTIAMVEQAIKENPDIKVLSMVHSETPSCTVNSVKEICSLAKKHGILSIVDSVSGIGSCEVRVDDWGIDICVVGSQKCLAAAPGLSIVSVSDFAWETMKKKDPPRWSVLCMLDWKEMWLENDAFPCTPSVSLVYALDAAVDDMLEEGLENAWKRHEKCARACRQGLKAMGVELWAAREEIAATCSTAFKIPETIDQLAFRMHMRNKYGILISAGLRDHANKLLRIGHMGYSARPTLVINVLTAVGQTFEDFGIKLDIAAGLAAAIAEL
ncbi:MAG TPA: alanine--glyoxylate aminotransferase family protein [Syntrophomonas sp.]|nr:alanine--glyoxylate aminotransferase family protein [Syntrophomonas sp.]